MSSTPRLDALTSEIRDRIEEIDLMLFDAGVLVLSGRCSESDRKITDARVKLEQLRANLT